MKNIRLHIPTFALHLLVIAGLLCLLSPNIVEANRQQSFREWLESSQADDQNRAEQDDQTQHAYLYQTWSDFHQSVTLGQAVLPQFESFTFDNSESNPGTGPEVTPSLLTSSLLAVSYSNKHTERKQSWVTHRDAQLSSISINAP